MHTHQHSQPHFQTYWETTRTAFLSINSNGEIIAANPASEQLFGYRHNEALQLNISELVPEISAISEDEYSLHSKRHTDSIIERLLFGESHFLSARHKNGRTFPVKFSLRKMTINDQYYYTVIIQDKNDCHPHSQTTESTVQQFNRILIVSSCPSLRKLVAAHLKTISYDSDIATNGIEALKYLSNKSYQCIFIDSTVRKVNGLSLADIIRLQEYGQTRHLPIIEILTNDASNIKQSKDAKIDCQLKLPIDAEEIKKLVYLHQKDSEENNSPLFATSSLHNEKNNHLNRDALINIYGKDESLHRQVVWVFHQSLACEIDKIFNAYRSNDLQELRTAASSLKLSAQSVGAQTIAAICQLCEACTYNGYPGALTLLTSQLKTAKLQIEAIINDFIHEQ